MVNPRLHICYIQNPCACAPVLFPVNFEGAKMVLQATIFQV